MSNYYTLGPMRVTGSSAFILHGVQDLDGDAATQLIRQHAAGAIDPSYQSVSGQKPSHNVTVCDIKAALDAITIAGLAIPQTTVYTTVEQFLQKMTENQARESGSNHAKLVTNYGMLLPEELSWQQEQYARLRLAVHAGYDGTNNPWVWSAGVALPATPAVSELYTGGPVYINGTVVPVATVQGVTLRWNYEVEKIAGSGEKWPRRLHVKSRSMMFEVATKNTLNLSTFGISGTAVGASTVKVYLRKYSLNQDLVADATAEHIKLTIANVQGQVVPGRMSITNNQAADWVLQLYPIGGSAAVVAVDTASAVS